MYQQVHPTFKNVCADQAYDLDRIITELAHVRDARMDSLLNRHQHILAAVEKGTPIPGGYEDQVTVALTHNALLVAKEMRKNGMETIVLNPGKDMRDQILAQATEKNCPGVTLYAVGVSDAKKRLDTAKPA